jgi:hypothetical protein
MGHIADSILGEIMPVIAKKRLIRVTSLINRNCPLCNGFEWGPEKDHFERLANHLLEHGLKCVHVGQETDFDDQRRPRQATVAVFGE